MFFFAKRFLQEICLKKGRNSEAGVFLAGILRANEILGNHTNHFSFFKDSAKNLKMLEILYKERLIRHIYSEKIFHLSSLGSASRNPIQTDPFTTSNKLMYISKV